MKRTSLSGLAIDGAWPKRSGGVPIKLVPFLVLTRGNPRRNELLFVGPPFLKAYHSCGLFVLEFF